MPRPWIFPHYEKRPIGSFKGIRWMNRINWSVKAGTMPFASLGTRPQKQRPVVPQRSKSINDPLATELSGLPGWEHRPALPSVRCHQFHFWNSWQCGDIRMTHARGGVGGGHLTMAVCRLQADKQYVRVQETGGVHKSPALLENVRAFRYAGMFQISLVLRRFLINNSIVTWNPVSHQTHTIPVQPYPGKGKTAHCPEFSSSIFITVKLQWCCNLFSIVNSPPDIQYTFL